MRKQSVFLSKQITTKVVKILLSYFCETDIFLLYLYFILTYFTWNVVFDGDDEMKLIC